MLNVLTSYNARDPQRLWRNVRWNQRIFSGLAYPMSALAGDSQWAAPPHDRGNHIRLQIDPTKGVPSGGFFLFRRPHDSSNSPTHQVDLTAVEQGQAPSLKIPVEGAREILALSLHPMSYGPGLPLAATSELSLMLSMSSRQITLEFLEVSANASVQFFYDGKLIHFEQKSDGVAGPWKVVCPDIGEEVVVQSSQIKLRSMSWCQVPGDLKNWNSVAYVPRLGSHPMTAHAIAQRLFQSAEPPSGEVAHLEELIAALRKGPGHDLVQWADEDRATGAKMEIGAGDLLSLLSTVAKKAWAFGLMMIDEDPPDEATDYLIMASWLPAAAAWKTQNTIRFDNDRPVLTSDVVPPYVTGPNMATLENLLAEVENLNYEQLLYCTTLYNVQPSRAWKPATLTNLRADIHAVEARRHLTANGAAVLEVAGQNHWRLASQTSSPLLAKQASSMILFNQQLPDLDHPGQYENSLHLSLGEAVSDNEYKATEVFRALAMRLDEQVQTTAQSLDIFGHLTGDSNSPLQIPLSKDLYPTAPPPIDFDARLSARTQDSFNLDVMFLWGGRLRLFHPQPQIFRMEWLEESDMDSDAHPGIFAPSDSTKQKLKKANWKTHPQNVEAQPTRKIRFQSETSHMPLQTRSIRVYRAEADGAPRVDGPHLFVELKTNMNIAKSAAGRLRNLSLMIRNAPYAVWNHSLGEQASFILKIGGGATQFLNFPPTGQWATFVETLLLVPDGFLAAVELAVDGADPTALDQFKAGVLCTQKIHVFNVFALVPGSVALLSCPKLEQEPVAEQTAPGPELAVRPLVGAEGNCEFDPLYQTTLNSLGLATTAPDTSKPHLKLWFRVRTVDHFGRLGEPSAEIECSWTHPAPERPRAIPQLVSASPPDHFGKCRLKIKYEPTARDLGYKLYRSTQTALHLTYERWKKTRQDLINSGSSATWEGVVTTVDNLFEDLQGEGLQNYISNLRLNIDGKSIPIFDDAFSLCGDMANSQDHAFAARDNDPFYIEDTVSGAATPYFYRAKAYDRAFQESPPSAVSDVVHGLDITPAAPPRLHSIYVSNTLALRWWADPDTRIQRYKIRVTPLDPIPGESERLLEQSVDQCRSPIRIENSEIALPPSAPVAQPVSIKTPNARELIEQTYSVVANRRLALWHANGSPALVEFEHASNLPDLSSFIPGEYRHGLANGTTVVPEALFLQGGAIETSQIFDGHFESLKHAQTGEELSQCGEWYDTPLLWTPRLAENQSVVLEISKTGSQKKYLGRCPASNSGPEIRVANGVIELTFLNPNERVTGIFRAQDVTTLNADRRLDPRAARNTDHIEGALFLERAFIRNLRNQQPIVLEFGLSTQRGGRLVSKTQTGDTLQFNNDTLSVPPWGHRRSSQYQAPEGLVGLYFGSDLTQNADGQLVVPLTAKNYVTEVTADSRNGTIRLKLTDRTPLSIIAVQNGAARSFQYRWTPIRWKKDQLFLSSLVEGRTLKSLYGLKVDAAGHNAFDTTVNRLPEVETAESNLKLIQPIAQGTPLHIEYAAGERLQFDRTRNEWSKDLTANDVGRRFKIEIVATCNFNFPSANPVGDVDSQPLVIQALIPEPSAVSMKVTQSFWSDDEFAVSFVGEPGLKYSLTLISLESDVYYPLGDDLAPGDHGFRSERLVALKAHRLRVLLEAKFPFGKKIYSHSDFVYRPNDEPMLIQDEPSQEEEQEP